MKKVLVLHNIISPIRVFLFNKLDKYYKEKGVEFKVIFLSISNKSRHWKVDNYKMNFKYEILNNFSIRIIGKDLNTFFINPHIYKKIQKENPDKIISFGWNNWATYASLYWCKKNKKVFTLWSGSTKFEKSWRRTLFSPLVKYLIRNSSNFIAYGTRAKEYLISLGAKKDKVQIIYNTVDIDYFRNKSEKFSEEAKKELKKNLGIKTTKTILFSGRLIRMKGIFEMVKGFKNFQKKDSDTSLLIMGTGPDKEKLKTYIIEQNIQNIYFSGFIQYADLYKYYSISDMLLFPSRQDIWGLVINEALACGLPVITTKEVGASIDLIQENKNGYIIPSKNSKAITQAIQKVFQNNLHKKNNSWEIVQKTKVEDILRKVKI